MTIHTVSSHLVDLSKVINGEHFSKPRLEAMLNSLFRVSDRYIGTILLPDGEWFFMVTRYATKPDGFDYYIPDNRDDNERLANLLLG